MMARSDLRAAKGNLTKIGFIGAGLIGGGLARLAVRAGHEVIVSNLRDPRSAIRARTRIAIRYADEQVQLTKRFIWPIQLSFMDRASVVASWCELRSVFPFFRTDRIRTAPSTATPARRTDLLRKLQFSLRAAGVRRDTTERN